MALASAETDMSYLRHRYGSQVRLVTAGDLVGKEILESNNFRSVSDMERVLNAAPAPVRAVMVNSFKHNATQLRDFGIGYTNTTVKARLFDSLATKFIEARIFNPAAQAAA
jgi:hypothetical protein